MSNDYERHYNIHAPKAPLRGDETLTLMSARLINVPSCSQEYASLKGNGLNGTKQPRARHPEFIAQYGTFMQLFSTTRSARALTEDEVVAGDGGPFDGPTPCRSVWVDRRTKSAHTHTPDLSPGRLKAEATEAPEVLHPHPDLSPERLKAEATVALEVRDLHPDLSPGRLKAEATEAPETLDPHTHTHTHTRLHFRATRHQDNSRASNLGHQDAFHQVRADKHCMVELCGKLSHCATHACLKNKSPDRDHQSRQHTTAL